MINHKGFSLIEIIVVIAIIATLAVVGMVVYSGASKSARISKRVQDLTNIKSALLQYKLTNGKYPIITTSACADDKTSGLASNTLQPAAFVPGYMNIIPKDPSGYCYYYISSSNGSDYKLATALNLSTSGEMSTSDFSSQPNLKDPSSSGNSDWAVYSGSGISTSGTQLIAAQTQPNCTSGATCSGTCTAPSNTCSTNNGTQTNCVYTQPAGCFQVSAPNQSCTITNCSGGYSCVSGQCLPACNSTPSCSGACTAPSNTCSTNNGTQTNCVYTTVSGGGSCTQAAAPDQSCSLSNCSSGYTCVSGKCIPPLAWTTTTSLPKAMYGHSSVVNNSKIYVLGGYTGSYQSGVYTATINSDGSLGAWNSTTSLPQVRAFHSSVVNNGKIYILGGANGGSYLSTVYTATINSDGSLGAWSSSTSLPQGMSGLTSIVNNGKIYVLGGYNSTNGALSTVYTATINSDGSLGAWNSTTSLPFGIYGAASVVNNGMIYITGGHSGNPGASISRVYRATINSDGSLGAWNSITPLPYGIESHTSVVNNGAIYVLGGYSNGATLSTVYRAAINSDGSLGASWITTTSLPQGMWGHTSLVNNSSVYVLGGYNGGFGIYLSTAYQGSGF